MKYEIAKTGNATVLLFSQNIKYGARKKMANL